MKVGTKGPDLNFVQIISARKRSLGQGNVLTPVCDSVHKGGRLPHWMLGYTPLPRQKLPRADTPLGRHPLGRHPIWADTPQPLDTTGYGQQADGTHPTGTHTCFKKKNTRVIVFLVKHLRVSLDLASLTLTSITLTLTGFPVWIKSTFDRMSSAVSCFCSNKRDSLHKYLWTKNSFFRRNYKNYKEITVAVWIEQRIAFRIAAGLRIISRLFTFDKRSSPHTSKEAQSWKWSYKTRCHNFLK